MRVCVFLLLRPLSCSSLSALVFVSGMHMVGESQSNKTSLPIPPLQVEECALWQGFSKKEKEKVPHLKDPPKQHRAPHLTGSCSLC